MNITQRLGKKTIYGWTLTKIFLSKTVGALILCLIGIAGLPRHSILISCYLRFLRIKEGGVVSCEAGKKERDCQKSA